MPVVQLLHTCLVNEFAPEVGFAVVRVLQRLGYDVQVPLDQTCCGQPAFNGGFQDPAREAARHTIAVLERTEGAIVIPSGSCGDMVIHQYRAPVPERRLVAGACESRCLTLRGVQCVRGATRRRKAVDWRAPGDRCLSPFVPSAAWPGHRQRTKSGNGTPLRDSSG